MLILLSPAKKLDFETPVPFNQISDSKFISDSEKLIKELKKLTPPKIEKLMSVSKDIAMLNFNRFQEWKTPFESAKSRAALFAFNGEAYNGLDAYSLSEKELSDTQQHLRILSGLYGILQPLDAILPYRLEMGTKLKNGVNKNLYEFWGAKITIEINELLKSSKNPTLVNLASQEYFKVVQPKNIKGTIITPTFKEYKNGEYKTIMVFAKKARGMMTRYIISNNLKTIKELKGFNLDGYEFNETLSNDLNFVFTR